jgi:hypothetical protein
MTPSSGCYIPEGSKLHTHHRENLKSRMYLVMFAPLKVGRREGVDHDQPSAKPEAWILFTDILYQFQAMY